MSFLTTVTRYGKRILWKCHSVHQPRVLGPKTDAHLFKVGPLARHLTYEKAMHTQNRKLINQLLGTGAHAHLTIPTQGQLGGNIKKLHHETATLG
jgi:hypothetical protein